MKIHPLKDSLINELHNRVVSSMVLLTQIVVRERLPRLVELAKQHKSILLPMQIVTMRVFPEICAGSATVNFQLTR